MSDRCAIAADRWNTYSRGLLVVLVICASSLATSAHGASDERPRWTIATFNVWNLCDDRDDPQHDDPLEEKPVWQLRSVARTIRSIDADILALQEVESRACLDQFVERYLKGQRYHHRVVVEANDGRGMDIALLSRFPVATIESHRHQQFADGRRFARDLLCVQLQVPDQPPLDVWVVHLRSRSHSTDNGRAARRAEIRFIRDQYESRIRRDPSARIVLLGDFNDTVRSQAMRELTSSRSTSLRSFLDEIPSALRVSYHLPPHQAMLDHILVSPALAALYVPRSYRVAPGDLQTLGSDHRPVVWQWWR